MSDINWRYFEEDKSLLQKENQNRSILIFTNIGQIRQSYCDKIDWRGRCYINQEIVIKYAFIN